MKGGKNMKPIDLNRLEEVIRDSLGPVQVEIKPGREVPAEEVTLFINDIEVKARQGMTVLQAAHSVGIDIPTLCYHEKLTPFGACRLCTVEIVKGQRSRLVTSCVYPVEAGLVVRTESKPVINVRKILLGVMWSRAPGVQAIRDLCIRYGVDTNKFSVEPTYCILCEMCVRYCSEVKKKNFIGFVGRGTERQVMFLPGADFNECSKCGECYGICPTGLMPSNYGLAQLPPGTARECCVSP
jgi:predicted molibdopterin-dependent oxidoreductase YjgC